MAGRVIHVLSGEEFDEYIGRFNQRYGLVRSYWANPYSVKEYGLAMALERFEQEVRLNMRSIAGYRSMLAGLSDKTLACWCARKDGPGLTLEDSEICHGQILFRLAEEVKK